MAAKDLDAVFYVKSVPEISFEEGTFRVSYDVGKSSRFEFVFSPNTFLKMRTLAGEVVAKWQYAGLDTVKPIGRKKRGH